MPAGLDELKAMQVAYAALEPLDSEERTRSIRWLIGALEVDGMEVNARGSDHGTTPAGGNGRGNEPTPREFISRKKPTTAVERIACLGYYLSHYRDMPTFKTADLTALNTDAAAPKFGNATRDVDNADRASGYLVTAGSGAKQVTVRGEALVAALPDREAVKQALEEHPHKRKRTASTAKKSTSAE